MASFGLGLLLLLLLLTTHPGSSKAQHWSHGWYPGGKRASSSSQEPQHAPWLPGGLKDLKWEEEGAGWGSFAYLEPWHTRRGRGC